MWAGWEEYKQSVESGTGWRCWIPPLADNVIYLDPPNFTSSLDACFKYLEPVLGDNMDWDFHKKRNGFYEFQIQKGVVQAAGRIFVGQDAAPALAMCKAFEKLIDSEGE